jgi:intracellular sulfur oxidation DsrE/DsrF family protein
MKTAIALMLIGAASAPVFAETEAAPATGPVIAGYGAVYFVPEQPLDLAADVELKAVFDVAAAPEDAGARNYRLDTVARYLNMHARAGVAPQQLTAAVVLHGRATRAALGEAAYSKRFGQPNPDADLIRLLAAAGVQFFVCGQSAAASGFRAEEIAPDVEISLSAMTALVMLQSDGFALIPWGMN